MRRASILRLTSESRTESFPFSLSSLRESSIRSYAARNGAGSTSRAEAVGSPPGDGSDRTVSALSAPLASVDRPDPPLVVRPLLGVEGRRSLALSPAVSVLPGDLLPPGLTSYCPFSSRWIRMRPRLEASARNFENLLNPKLPSLKLLSSSIITCLRRSERMTSPRLVIF